ncbi:GRAM domain-containing protein 2A-like isoform X2 [Neocloeon triangulifer]|uniref:GRAM domain-containing protein 2A-like isoform X2 n=1 Tax=Neocloeon triangulifer TaxID=2078957 RepID=UPI00286ECA70|nr:GRAM domain-containing protein 2A-like isoform X2 [Neocloeon triangulifer]
MPNGVEAQLRKSNSSNISTDDTNSSNEKAGGKSPTVAGPPFKQFSVTGMTASDQQEVVTVSLSELPVGSMPPGSNKGRQKKFHRHFKTVSAEERVLNYYSCALVADILLQGHLYITKNYFAFYSNVFGYVTKLLIPTASVLKVTKEKTARIIPNAVGIATLHEKHVFSSLLSRDSTYKLMVQVWKNATAPEIVEIEPIPLPTPTLDLDPLSISVSDISKEEVTPSESGSNLVADEDEESSLSGSGNEDPPTIIAAKPQVATFCTRNITVSSTYVPKTASKPSKLERFRGCIKNYIQSVKWHELLLLTSTVLLLMLFLSAAFLLYRINAIQAQFYSNPVISSRDDVYKEIMKWQVHLHSKSSNEVQQFLNSNLNQIAKVRQSLEALTLLVTSDSEGRLRKRHHSGILDPNS